MTKILSVEKVELASNKSNPPTLVVSAFGTANTPGWTNLSLQPLWNQAQPAKDGVYEFAFTGNPPSGPVAQVLTSVGPVSYTLTPDETSDAKKVIVHADTNSVTEEHNDGGKRGFAPVPAGTPETATGYSNNWDFGEALKDAIANLPPDENPFPDKLENYTVVSTGAEIGGIAGFNRLKVTVTRAKEETGSTPSGVTTSEWAAWIDKMPPLQTPGGTLHISGKVDTHNTDLAFLQRRNPQGINAEILLLDLIVVTGIVPVENPQLVHYREALDAYAFFSSVEIFYKGKREAFIEDIQIAQ